MPHDNIVDLGTWRGIEMLRSALGDDGIAARRDRAMLRRMILACCSEAEAAEALAAMRQVEWAQAGHVPSAIAWLEANCPEWR
jgi:hypothetical protein